MSEVQIVSVEFTNLRNFDKQEIRFKKMPPGEGQLITLTGPNGVGKTNALIGIQAPFDGGYQPNLIRDGCDKAVVRMILSNGVDIKFTTTRNGSTIKIGTEDGMEVKAPATYMKKLASGFGFNPLEFIAAKPKERLEYLLKVLPMDFTQKEIGTALGVDGIKIAESIWTQLKWYDGDRIDISGANRLIKDLIEKRGAIGSRRDEKAASVESARKRLATSDQGDTPKDWKKELARLEARKGELDKAERDELALIEKQIADVRGDLHERIRKAESQVRDEYEKLVKEARAGLSFEGNRMALLRGCLASLGSNIKELAESEAGAKSAIDEARAANAEELQKLAGEIATAKAGAEEQIRAGAIREDMERLRKEAQALSKDWDTVKAAITNLEELRKSKLKGLPVEGLEVREDGLIYFHGRDLDQWNDAEKMKYAVDIAALGLGELGLMVLDRTEMLDAANWKWLEDAVVSKGITAVAARVDKDALAGLRSEPAEALVTA